MNKIISWNCRGLLGKLAEFSNFMLTYDIICLQETWLRSRDVTEFGGYEVLRGDRQGEVGGGIAIICRASLDPSLIKLNCIDLSVFEYVSCIVNKIKICSKPLLLISIYRPPSNAAGVKRWEKLISSLESLTKDFAVLLCGDLNTQHASWGSTRPNPAGICLSSILTKSSLTFLNDGSATRISANRDHVSVPDLTIASIEMMEVCNWRVLEEPMGSDHLPVSVDIDGSHRCDRGSKPERPKLILTYFNDDLFIKYMKEAFKTETFSDINGADLYHDWYNTVIECCLKAGAVLHKTNGDVIKFDSENNQIVSQSNNSGVKRKSRINKPWWDRECEKALIERKKAYRMVLNNPNRENLRNYRVISHETRKCLRKRKRANFKSFVSNITGTSIGHFWESISKMKNCAFNNRKSFPSTSRLEAAKAAINRLAPAGCYNDLSFSEPFHCHSFFLTTFSV